MLGGKGYYRGSSILVSGTAGTGKTSLAAAFVDSRCRGGERCLYFSFEESPEQIIRNMRSIGIDLEPVGQEGAAAVPRGAPARSTAWRCTWRRCTSWSRSSSPEAVVIDPITNLISVGDSDEVKAMLTRLIDFLKSQGITSDLHQPDRRRRARWSRARSASPR